MEDTFLSCPIRGHIMTDPVIIADGYSYERAAIDAVLKQPNPKVA
jgi:hypothetical protein